MGLERIEVGAFCGISNISTLDLNFNKLTSLPQLCSLKCCLVNLQIGSNKLLRLSKHFFKGFKKLQSVSVTNNYLLVLPDLHYIQHSVSRLMARGNKIQSLDGLQTSGIYTRLRTITLYDNNIRNFNVSLLRHMPKLDVLSLSGNKLCHIADLRGFDLGHLHLLNNPWHCGEELSWMGEEDMDFERGLTCATPACLHGMVIANMSKWIVLPQPFRFKDLTSPEYYSSTVMNCQT